jgi:hypothetical protein
MRTTADPNPTGDVGKEILAAIHGATESFLFVVNLVLLLTMPLMASLLEPPERPPELH